jgi:hypothetical protein
MRDLPASSDKWGRTYSVRCVRCGWKFRCPVEQSQRITCRACESKGGEHAIPSTA